MKTKTIKPALKKTAANRKLVAAIQQTIRRAVLWRAGSRNKRYSPQVREVCDRRCREAKQCAKVVATLLEWRKR